MRMSGMVLVVLLATGAIGIADEPKSERELILAVGIKMGDLNRVYIGIRAELDKQPADSKGKKNWEAFSKELRDEMAKVATGINDAKFQPKSSLEALSRLERELMVWQSLEEERRGNATRPAPATTPLLGGVLPAGPTLNLVQYDPVQMAALDLLQNPEKLKALQKQWQNALGVPPPKAGEPYGKTLQSWMMEDMKRRGLTAPPPKK